ncbi:DUF1186 domain-containing protein [Ralstonia solanacearum]|uniref:YecA family protein n=1 Tax=Ralstonia solanacearum TaxID=305 RepID=UPI0005C60424|nr:DUF1186 domain-containing protein [Ralstonia solanacearum]MDB0544352.1 DUF1186 domain-containing protein [Ralstonia solanacearum]MDB0554205.1 DUF1186 domain-containing protein [Ralstonia solanacearum]MDB0559291.1 DUF1186 domain-containing protein [Ralstonia solanacearum]
MSAYSYPVNQLLTLGRNFGNVSSNVQTWTEYESLGINASHIPELIAVLTDKALHEGHGAAPLAPVHAWRILAQLQAAQALPALISLLHSLDEIEDDWISSEFPDVFSMIGGASVEVLAAYVADNRHGEYARATGCSAIGQLGRDHLGERERCVKALTSVLGAFEKNSVLNGAIIAALMELNASEAIGLIRDAFARGCIDVDYAGDVEDVELELGLRTERSTPRQHGTFFQYLRDLSDVDDVPLPRVAGPKIGRNEPCPCGSGKKYKKCCLGSASN